MTHSTVAGPEKKAVLSRELSELLVEMSIGVHRYAMYPPDHPSLNPVVENIVGRLAEVFVDQDTLSIGVAERRLVVEGVATDQKHPVLSDLATRLHGHQLAAFSFDKGVTASEVAGVLEVLARESEREGIPIGLLGPDDFPTWAHAHLYRVGYEHLQTDEGGGGGHAERASSLWLGLAQAALAMTDPEAAGAYDERAVAASISGRKGEGAYDQVIVGYLHELAGELKEGKGSEADKIRRRVSGLLNELDEERLGRLVAMGGSAAQKRQFLLDANQSLAVDSVMKVLESAARSDEETISTSMTRLLSKLATHASSGGGNRRSQADTALRENVESLIAGWELKDPNPEAYTTVLDAMSRASPIFEPPEEEGGSLTGAERILQMSLEVDAFGPLVKKALQDVIEVYGTAWVMERLDELPDGNRMGEHIRSHLASPAQFRSLLAGGRMDDRSLRTLVQRMGASAIPPLLDVLAESDDRAVRRRVFDALADLGPEVGIRAVERMRDGRWFVVRNMLALLHRLPDVPEDLDLKSYVEHDDHRVRREAFPLAMRHPNLRSRTLAAALADEDERMVRMGLLEIQDSVPASVVPSLVNRVVLAEERSQEIQSFAIKVLRHSRSALALKALIDLSLGGKTLLGRPKLAAKTGTVLSALHTLALSWSENAEARAVLDLAAKSKDPDMRGAVRAGLSEAAKAAKAGDPEARRGGGS